MAGAATSTTLPRVNRKQHAFSNRHTRVRHKKSNRLHQNCHQKGWRPARLITTQQHSMQQRMPTASIPAHLYKHQPPGNQARVPINADQQ